jgi:hypothetical protein
VVSLEEFTKSLGDYAKELTYQEIERLKQIEEQLADILILSRSFEKTKGISRA